MADTPSVRRAALAALGLPEHASARDITAAYRRLAKVTHPDAAAPADTDAARRFAALAEAYRMLSGPGAAPPPSDHHSSPGAGPRRVPVRVRAPGTAEADRPPIIAGPVTITAIRRDRHLDR